jgi:hypothetical protein
MDLNLVWFILEKYQLADGILCQLSGGILRLRLDHLQQFILDCLGSNGTNVLLRLVKRSETHIYDNYMNGLARLLKELLDLDARRPLGAVCRGIFGSGEDESSARETNHLSQPVVLYDENLRSDLDKMRVLGKKLV